MPIIIESNYSKKLGLPGYSSHSYSLTVRTELADLNQLERESAKLYAILQGSVDREIQEEGFIPELRTSGATPRTNGHATHANGEEWACSDNPHPKFPSKDRFAPRRRFCTGRRTA